MPFVAPFPYNGSRAKELGSQNSQFQEPNVTSTHAQVNGWGGGYYPNGCPHCGYCPTCGRSNGHGYYPTYYMGTQGSATAQGASQQAFVNNCAHAHVQ